ncbi:MAG: modification methylase, partial [Euryarchaeota archaeon CG_4_9_14_3_um_filter_38_12]
DEDQRKLSKLYKKLDRKGCLLMLSNSDHPFIKNLYDGYRIEKVGARRMINCDAEKRGTVKEITVLNY